MKIANFLGTFTRFWRKNRKAKTGLIGEAVALVCLAVRGYIPLPYNTKNRAQIDIIAKKGQNLWLIEVKTRQNWADHARALSFSQRQRLAKEVTYFQQKYPKQTVGLALVSVCPTWPFVKLHKL